MISSAFCLDNPIEPAPFLGRCDIRPQIDLDVGADVSSTAILLVTDRNDGGQNFSGVDFDVLRVQTCPATDCSSAGGVCSSDKLCTCAKSLACDCSCENSLKSSKAPTIIISLVFGGVILLLVLFFLRHNRKQKETLQSQRETIRRTSELLQTKEAQLKEFHLGATEFGDAVA